MGRQRISENAAFSQGATLWIVPNAAHSSWARKIDWYLNFQMAKAQSHRSAKISDGLMAILSEEHLAPPSGGSEGKLPLMISSHHRLPAQQTVELPFGTSVRTWLQNAIKVWQDLGKPSMRIFAPKGIEAAQVDDEWPKEFANAHVGVVCEAKARS